MTEQTLSKLRQNDPKAQYEFYSKFSVQMFRVVYRYVTNEQDAGSIVNLGFYKAFSNFKSFNLTTEASLKAWIKKIMINESLSFIRQQTKHLSVDGVFAKTSYCERPADNELILEDYYKLIQGLPNDLRTVFNLYAIDGYTHKEVSVRLGINESSSRVYLARARRILQKSLLTNELSHGE